MRTVAPISILAPVGALFARNRISAWDPGIAFKTVLNASSIDLLIGFLLFSILRRAGAAKAQILTSG
jgi:hypothetical protein